MPKVQFRAVAMAMCLAISGFSQSLPPGIKKGASVEGITEYTFPNGLRVLLFPDTSNPKVTLNMTYLVGSRHEGYGETGLAHLLEHLLFIETTNGRFIKKELTGRGASWNGSTDDDRTNYFETVTAGDDNLRWALGLEADRMVRSKMDKALLDREMTVVRNEFERGENSITRVLQERVRATAYLWHNYGKSTIGSRSDIENVPIERLDAFYRKYYQPDNVVAAITGHFDESKTLRMVEETLGRIPRPARKLDATYTAEPPQDGERYIALRRVGEGRTIMVSYHTPAGTHPDSAPLEVLANLMSGGGSRGGPGGTGSGRLYKALVENKKAVSVRMSSIQLHDPGFAYATVQLSGEQSAEEARHILIQTIESLVKEPPSAEELERAKSRLVRSLEMRMADSQSVGLNLSEWVAMGDWRMMFLNRDRIKNVSAQDVARVAAFYFMESNRTVGEFIPTEKPERAAIPANPDLTEMFKGYTGGKAVAQGESFDPTPANVESRLLRSKLANGMKLVLLPRKTRGGTISTLVELHYGDEKSLAGQAAVAQMTGSLLMRGTRTHSREQIQDEMVRLKSRITVSGGGGGGFSGSRRGGGSPVSTGVADASASIETDGENLVGALRLAVEMLREPAFAESDLEQVRQQRIASLETNRADPQAMAALELQRRTSPFSRGDVRYVGTLAEQIEELKKVTLEDVRNFHARFYGASGGELVATGDFNQAQLQKAAAELLGGWNSSGAYQRLTTPFKKTEPVNFKIETPDKENAMFEVGVRIPMSDDDPDFPAMLLANAMFGGSLGSRMPNRIRNVEGLSYSVSSRFSAPARGNGALFSASAISAPQNTPKVEASFLDELSRTLKSGFTPDEVATAKKAFRDQERVARSREQSLIRNIATREQAGRTMKWDEQLDAKVQALTVDQINAAFRRLLDPAALTIVKAGDFQKAGVYR